MYIYLNNSQEMRDELVVNPDPNAEKDALEFNGTVIHVYSAIKYPYVKTGETEVEALMRNDCLEHYFLKAVNISFPLFSAPRECGIYVHEACKAELRRGKEPGTYRLKTEVTCWQQLENMPLIEEEIFAGDIRPICSYERKQNTRRNIYFYRLKKKIRRFFKITKK